VTSNLDPGPRPAGDARPRDARPAESTAADPGVAGPGTPASPRRARAALLTAGLLVGTTAAVAAFEPKFPKLVGD
jgi:hypothetical protein